MSRLFGKKGLGAPPWPGPRSRATRARAMVSGLTGPGRKAPASRFGLVAAPPARPAPEKRLARQGPPAASWQAGCPGVDTTHPDSYRPQRFRVRASRRCAAPLMVRGPPSDSKADQGGTRAQGGGPGSGPKIKRRGGPTRNLKADVPARESTALQMTGGAFPVVPRLIVLVLSQIGGRRNATGTGPAEGGSRLRWQRGAFPTAVQSEMGWILNRALRSS
jgi:hypothetical protein